MYACVYVFKCPLGAVAVVIPPIRGRFQEEKPQLLLCLAPSLPTFRIKKTGAFWKQLWKHGLVEVIRFYEFIVYSVHYEETWLYIKRMLNLVFAYTGFLAGQWSDKAGYTDLVWVLQIGFDFLVLLFNGLFGRKGSFEVFQGDEKVDKLIG